MIKHLVTPNGADSVWTGTSEGESEAPGAVRAAREQRWQVLHAEVYRCILFLIKSFLNDSSKSAQELKL